MKKTLTVNGSTLGDNCRGASIADTKVIEPFNEPMKKRAGFTVLRGNLFDSAIMKTSVISTSSAPAICRIRKIRRRSRVARSCSMVPRTITHASTIRRWASMRTR